ncbi:hypothetical protein K466DRAFT_304997 [Polyporus arcularius HHB13444]|uniref:Uncharacterized protein n=1 Tax=Polyporus arcularius HHB13444 TaxID=1314778 RepID=A0A5C3P0G1_9APHY|nr:hypothetical protein K466DRAFT_304997 [Polyporus arcularius HHB13444]
MIRPARLYVARRQFGQARRREIAPSQRGQCESERGVGRRLARPGASFAPRCDGRDAASTWRTRMYGPPNARAHTHGMVLDVLGTAAGHSTLVSVSNFAEANPDLNLDLEAHSPARRPEMAVLLSRVRPESLISLADDLTSLGWTGRGRGRRSPVVRMR